MVDTKEQRDALVKKVYADNFTHVDDCQDIRRLCQMIDELQARAESAEEKERIAMKALLETKTTFDSLRYSMNSEAARADTAEQERDKLRAALDHAESHIQEMENAEGRAFFADTAAMAKQLGDTMQERDTLAERVKALEGAIDYLFSQESLSDSDVREVKRLLKGNANA